MKRKLIVVGGGTAGLISAITLIQTCPDATVTVIRSSLLGHIMVGEGTFAATPRHLHGVLGIPKRDFYEGVNPTWKLGLRLIWGPRPFFDFPFNEQFSNQILPSSTKPWGYYSLGDWKDISPLAVVSDDKVPPAVGYHFENQRCVTFLERYFERLGGTLIDAKVTSVRRSEQGIASVCIDSGETHAADFFVDASGFAAQLIHKELAEPYISMRSHLFCDKAVVGFWSRGDDEPIKLYTTAETMDAGWCWQIEHEKTINRGYVYCSGFISDDEAAAEFTMKNPKLNKANLRIVPFETRRIRRAWVKNVVAIGNACGFVEPLEATNIQVICVHALRFAQTFNTGNIDAQTIETFNEYITSQWETVRDFLALHYRFNTRLETPFWEMAIHDTPLGELEGYVKAYQETGPNLLNGGLGLFSHDGCLALLLGMRVPWNNCPIR